MAPDDASIGFSIPQSQPDAYRTIFQAIVASWASNVDEVQAWKLGASTFASRSDVESPTSLFGPLTGSQVITDTEDVPFSSGRCLEVEVAIRFTAKNGFEWCWAVDLPSKVEFKQGEYRWESLLKSNCGAGYMLLLEPYRNLATEWPVSASVELNGRVTDLDFSRLISSPLETFSEFHAVARDAGVFPPIDTWVAIGGLTPCIQVTGGETVSLWENDQKVAMFSLAQGGYAG